MPFQSEKQRRFLHANHPEIAKRWERDYANGGILDINASEEIISDDGNDIELTAYNAAFDDPNDLSTGVKSLFRAKEGGRIGFKKGTSGAPGGGDPGMTSGGGKTGTGGKPGMLSTPQQQAEQFAGRTTSTSTPSGKDIHPPTSPKDTWDPGTGAPQHVPKTRLGVSLHGGPKFKYTKDLVDKNTKMAKAKYEEHIKGIKNKYGKNFVKKVGWSLITKTFDFGLSDVWNAAVVGYKLNKAKEDYMGILENNKAKYQELGVPDFNPHVDTEIQKIDQEILDLTQRPDKDEDDKGDGPELPKVVPIGEEIEEYEGTYAMSPWERIKANQVKRAMLVEKGIIQDSPIVGESVTDITMQANSGGLANLFRVKNQ